MIIFILSCITQGISLSRPYLLQCMCAGKLWVHTKVRKRDTIFVWKSLSRMNKSVIYRFSCSILTKAVILFPHFIRYLDIHWAQEDSSAKFDVRKPDRYAKGGWYTKQVHSDEERKGDRERGPLVPGSELWERRRDREERDPRTEASERHLSLAWGWWSTPNRPSISEREGSQSGGMSDVEGVDRALDSPTCRPRRNTSAPKRKG